MPCFRPIQAWRAKSLNDSGKRPLVFSRSSAFVDMPIRVPCGKCVGCKSKQQNEWALRCTHEASFHKQNCFITLTYDDVNLPEDGGLHHEHFQKFMKRLRKKFPDRKIKYFMCGEYGAQKERPHFHAILFGFDFEDKTFWNRTGKVINYISETLAELWPFGYHTIGSMHYGTARYTAKYSMKRMAEAGIDYGDRRPEYRRMSQGIGADYAKKYRKDIETHDCIIYNAHRNPVPRYYEKFLDPDALQCIKANRVGLIWKKGQTPLEQLYIKEIIYHAKEKLNVT